LGENFVAFRTLESKEVFILDAYCPHMGANLGVGGLVVGDCIECPFHQWKFSGKNGACVNIPYIKNSSESSEFTVLNRKEKKLKLKLFLSRKISKSKSVEISRSQRIDFHLASC
jgi:nitrite reductase/ring-hydroxylating ferredoxin subunit